MTVFLLRLAATLAAAAAIATTGSAQEAKPAPTTRSLRLLPLGEPPPFRQEIRDGVRYELEPDPNSIPPRQITLSPDPAATPIRLNLGRATNPIEIPFGTAPVTLRPPAASPDAPPATWLTFQPPESGNLIALIWRDPGKPWTTPRAMVLPDSAEAFPSGNLRIVNLLPVESAAIFGQERVLIPPGKSLLRPIPRDADLPIQIAFRNASGQLQRFFSSSVLLNVNERAQLFLYRADGEKPRQPAKVVIFNEATPKPAAP